MYITDFVFKPSKHLSNICDLIAFLGLNLSSSLLSARSAAQFALPVWSTFTSLSALFLRQATTKASMVAG